MPYNRHHDPYWSYPDMPFKDATVELVVAARLEYGTLWMNEELLATIEFLQEQFPNGGQHFLEIGSAQGASFHCFGKLFNGMKISVDLPVGFGNSSIGIDGAKNRHNKWVEFLGDDVHSIIGASQDMVEEVRKTLNGELLDWLFIDGDHRYERAKGDFDLYKEFVRPGGFIGFHDINNPHPECVGVGQAWREIKAAWPGRVWETDWHWNGIGILY